MEKMREAKTESVHQTVSTVSKPATGQEEKVPAKNVNSMPFWRPHVLTKRESLHSESEVKAWIKARIPEHFQLGTAIGQGDCFFDAVAQGLNQLIGKEQHTLKSLREDCHRYAKDPQHTWVKAAIRKDHDHYEQYLVRIAFTVDEMKTAEWNVSKEPAVRGRPHIEGQMLCKLYGIQLHVIEILEDEKTHGLVIMEKLIDSQGSHSIEFMPLADYDKANILHLVVYHNHFVPLLANADHSLSQTERMTPLNEHSQKIKTIKLMEEYSSEVREGNYCGSFKQYIDEFHSNEDIHQNGNMQLNTANLSGDKDYIIVPTYRGETDFSELNFSRSDLSNANCLLAKFDKSNFDSVTISGILDLNPARIHTALKIHTLKPNGNDHAKKIKFKALNLNELVKKYNDENIIESITRYKNLYDKRLCTQQDVKKLLEEMESITKLEAIIDSLSNSSSLPNDSTIKVDLLQATTIQKIDDLFSLVKAFPKPKFSDYKLLMEILALSLFYARLINDKEREQKAVKKIVIFIINTFLKDKILKDNISKELNDYLKSFPHNLEQIRKIVLINSDSSDNIKEYLTDKTILYKEFLKKIFELIDRILGDINCKYSIVYTGSLATSLATAYSNINFFILIEKIDAVSLNYFHHFIMLAELLIISCGQTDPCPVLKQSNLMPDRYLPQGFNLDNCVILNGSHPYIDIISFSFDSTFEVIIQPEMSNEHIEFLNSLLITEAANSDNDPDQSLHSQYRNHLMEYLKQDKGANLLINLLTHMSKQCNELLSKLKPVYSSESKLTLFDLKHILLYLTETAKLLALLLNRKNDGYKPATNFWGWISQLQPHLEDKTLYQIWLQSFTTLMREYLNYQNKTIKDISWDDIDKIRIDHFSIYDILTKINSKLAFILETKRPLKDKILQEVFPVSSQQAEVNQVSSSASSPALTLNLIEHQSLRSLKTLDSTMQSAVQVMLEAQKEQDPNKRQAKEKQLQLMLERDNALAVEEDENRNTLLHYGAYLGSAGAISCLLDHSVSLAAENIHKLQALHLAAFFGNVGATQALLSRGAKLTRITLQVQGQEVSCSPFHLAILNGQLDIVQTFFKEVRFANFDQSLHELRLGKTGNILHLAVLARDPWVLRELVRHPAIVPYKDLYNELNQEGLTPLALAVSINNLAAIHILANHSNVILYTQSDRKDRTALHIAARAGRQEAVKALLKTFSQSEAAVEFINMKDSTKQRKTAFQVAQKRVSLFEQEKRDKRDPELITYKLVKNSLDNFDLNAFTKLRQKPTYSELRIRNLVFKGGGPKGIAYVGALAALDSMLGQYGASLELVERVAGTSAGAITALSVALNFNTREMEQVLDALDINKFVEDINIDRVKGIIERAKQMLATNNISKTEIAGLFLDVLKEAYGSRNQVTAGINLALHRQKIWDDFKQLTGLCSGDAFLSWVRGMIHNKLQADGIDKEFGEDYLTHFTFGKLATLVQRKRYKHLFVVATRVGDKPTPVTMSSEDSEWANVEIAKAIRASMSIPGLFVPYEITRVNQHGQTVTEGYMDGGIVMNYPIKLFDKVLYLKRFMRGADDYEVFNEETLGFRLESKEDLQDPLQVLQEIDTNAPTGIFDFIKQLMLIFYDAQNLIAQFENKYQYRSIGIDNCGVGTLDFDIKPEQRAKLKEAGVQAVLKFYQQYGNITAETQQPMLSNSPSIGSDKSASKLPTSLPQDSPIKANMDTKNLSANRAKQGEESEKKNPLGVNFNSKRL